jgi:hypothetical protein
VRIDPIIPQFNDTNEKYSHIQVIAGPGIIAENLVLAMACRKAFCKDL